MRKLGILLILSSVALLPGAAQADFVLEASIGSGFTTKPVGRYPTNVMVAPGYGLGEMIRLELGLMAEMGDVEARKFDVQLRPMLVLDPPVFPLYGRLILSVINLINDEAVDVAYGGALGLGLSVGPIGMFMEAGVLPIGKADKIIIEGRFGVYLAF